MNTPSPPSLPPPSDRVRMRPEGLDARLCPVCGGLRKPSRAVCSPRCRAKRHRLRQAARVREVMELLEAALKRLGAGT